MSYPGVSHQKGHDRIGGVVLALIFGALVFAVLVALTNGYLIAVLFAVIAMILVGSLHYLFWGRAMMRTVPAGRVVMPPPARLEIPPEEFTVAISDQERATLLRVLNQLTAEQRLRAGSTPQEEAVLRRLRDKLQQYGA